MTKQNINIEKMLAELSCETLNTSQVSNIFDNPKEFPTALIEEISIETALKYWKEQLSYEAADCIMNNLYSFWMNNDYFFKSYPFTEVAWECYEAFDAGEYYRHNDDKNSSPALKYTGPLVEELLRKRLLIA